MMNGEPLSVRFSMDIHAVVDKYRDQGITVGEILGALLMVQAVLVKEALEPDEDGDLP